MSRKIDALVAEKVMGKRYWKETRGQYRLCVGEYARPRGPGRIEYVEPWKSSRDEQQERYEQVTAMEAQQIGFFGTGIKPYSTDIASAWEVWSNPIVRMHVEYIMPSIDHEDGRLMHWCCAVRFNKDRFGCVHNNPAMALCEAALRAVGVTESEIEAARNQTKGTQ